MFLKSQKFIQVYAHYICKQENLLLVQSLKFNRASGLPPLLVDGSCSLAECKASINIETAYKKFHASEYVGIQQNSTIYYKLNSVKTTRN